MGENEKKLLWNTGLGREWGLCWAGGWVGGMGGGGGGGGALTGWFPKQEQPTPESLSLWLEGGRLVHQPTLQVSKTKGRAPLHPMGHTQ